MKSYDIIKLSQNQIEFNFTFKNKVSTVVISAVSLSLLIFIMIRIGIKNGTDLFFQIVFALLLAYLSLNSWWEWRKNRKQNLLIRDEGLIINGKKHCEVYNIKNIVISYSNSQIEGGWSVKLERHLNFPDYIIKQRLNKKDAESVAEELSLFLDKPFVSEN